MQQNSSTGSIYDLGYRPYDGQRLGRNYAIMSLFWYSLKSIFGLGRSGWAKAFPIFFFLIALLPAIAQLAFAALAPEDFELIRPEDYLGYTQIVLSLFCAVAAPELIGRDQRSRTLALYFSRALSRADYVSAKLASLAAALFLVTFVPQLLLILGNAVANDDVLNYLGDNAGDWPPIFASCAVVALFMGSVSLAIAVNSPRRAISTGAVLGYFVIFTALGAILLNTVTGDSKGYFYLLSPGGLLDGLSYWMFSVEPGFDSDLGKANLEGYVYFLATAAYIGGACALLYRRFIRMSL